MIFIALCKHGEQNLYRLIDMKNGRTKDIEQNKLSNYRIRNIELHGNNIECTEGEFKDYPIIGEDGKVTNNIPVVISVGKEVVVANYEGKLIKLPEGVLLSKINKFANASVDNNKIILSKSNTQRTYSKTDNSISIYDLIMKAPEVEVNTDNFNSRNYYKTLGVTDKIFKKPYDIFVDKDETSETIEEDSSAYEFEIVTVENRVELRKYKGDRYTGLVRIPPNVTHICKEAFLRARATELIMPDSVIHLGDSCFYGSKFKRVRLSRNVEAIPHSCFMLSSIEEIDLSNITSIDNMAFCKSRIKEVILKAPIIQIGFEAFEECTGLTRFEHAKTIKKIRHNAFDGCINLTYFDFESVLTIEQYAFKNTGLKKVVLNGEVNYLQNSTFTGDIEEIELLEGFEKISGGAVSNRENKPITWIIGKSVKNIEKTAFTKQDTVICYRKSIAASQAIMAEAKIIYKDELDKSSVPNIVRKAEMLDTSVADILSDTLKKILSKGEFSCTYEIDENKVVRQDIPSIILDFVGGQFKSGRYATDEDISNEKVKFKCILQHLSNVAMFDITPFSSTILKLKDTLRIERKSGKFETLYNDGVSVVYRINYIDNKFTSIDSSFIVAKTYDTLRYICMDNKFTNIMCEDIEMHDISALLKVLRPGDTIGLSSVIAGVKYPEISAESNKEIEVSKGNVKKKIKLSMNIYQALRYSSITIKLDSNSIVLMLPGNNTIIKCASLGKTVWLNEKEETYKSLQCTIESIEDLDNNTVFDQSTAKSKNYGPLFKKIVSLGTNQYDSYIEQYSHIYASEQSMYKFAGDYAYVNGITSVANADMEFMQILFKTSLFEERQESWLKDSRGKTIVPDAQHEFELSDGSKLYQYRAVRKTALRSKLMSGGDRKIYVFELIDAYGICEGIYLSLYDINTLVNMCVGINDDSIEEKLGPLVDKRIFENKEKFDTVDYSQIIEIAIMCRDSIINVFEQQAQFVFAVFKRTGLYYIGLKIKYGNTFRFIPLIQIGEMEVALGLVEDSNKSGIKNDSISYLYKASLIALRSYVSEKLGRTIYKSYPEAQYLGVLEARKMCIEGVSDIKEYNKIGLPEVLKRCLGYSIPGRDLYIKPDKNTIQRKTIDTSSIDDIDMDASSVRNMIQSGVSDDSFEIDEDDFGDI